MALKPTSGTLVAWITQSLFLAACRKCGTAVVGARVTEASTLVG